MHTEGSTSLMFYGHADLEKRFVDAVKAVATMCCAYQKESATVTVAEIEAKLTRKVQLLYPVDSGDDQPLSNVQMMESAQEALISRQASLTVLRLLGPVYPWVGESMVSLGLTQAAVDAELLAMATAPKQERAHSV